MLTKVPGGAVATSGNSQLGPARKCTTPWVKAPAAHADEQQSDARTNQHRRRHVARMCPLLETARLETPSYPNPTFLRSILGRDTLVVALTNRPMIERHNRWPNVMAARASYTRRLGSFARRSLWPLAAVCTLLALLLLPVVRYIDARVHWSLLRVGPEGARQVLSALSSSLLTFLVFGVSMLLLAVQIASGQLTPLLIARIFETPLTKTTVGIFVFAWVFALGALSQIDQGVPQLPVALAVALSLVGVVLFIHLVQSSVRNMRPVAVLLNVGDQTRVVIERLYPPLDASAAGESVRPQWVRTLPARTVLHAGDACIMLGVDSDKLVDIATRANCTIEVSAAAGDLRVPGAELFRLYGPGAPAVSELELHECAALGSERALERDAAFGFRIIVDIAIRALSPAINDPTTAVLAIDQLQQLLCVLGTREIDSGLRCDSAGVLRVIYATPGWQDYVELATTEILYCGASSAQVTRRLAAMFEDLRRTLPSSRAGPIDERAALLTELVAERFADPRQRAYALQPDRRGIGIQPPRVPRAR